MNINIEPKEAIKKGNIIIKNILKKNTKESKDILATLVYFGFIYLDNSYKYEMSNM